MTESNDDHRTAVDRSTPTDLAGAMTPARLATFPEPAQDYIRDLLAEIDSHKAKHATATEEHDRLSAERDSLNESLSTATVSADEARQELDKLVADIANAPVADPATDPSQGRGFTPAPSGGKWLENRLMDSITNRMYS